jgi:hypothetical protein
MTVGEVPAPRLAEIIELPVPRDAPAGGDAVADGDAARDAEGGRPARRWPAYILVACGVALVPWLVVLALTLPSTASTPHWMAAWVGLDAMEAAGLVTTGLLTLRRHPLRVASAAATAMLLVVDAWFDVATSTGSDLTVALLMAGTAELPLAATCAALAIRASAARRPLPDH